MAPWKRFLPIILANLIPLLGVLWLGWDLGETVLVFWIEATALVAVAAIRILLVRSLAPPTRMVAVVGFLLPLGLLLSFYLALIIVFIVRRSPSGTVFTWSDLGASLSILATLEFAAAGVALLLSHGVPAIASDLKAGRMSALRVLGTALGALARVCAQMVIVLVGGALYASLFPRAGAVVLAILVLVKTIADLAGQALANVKLNLNAARVTLKVGVLSRIEHTAPAESPEPPRER